ncbi:hypothetical protein [Nonomuraea sp. LPB2021202275-12-8]|uniref:hypothetical protein n=1 Tax=Nonomuraea sp. LPB2021202275-12-8 TaxID=3120159 RepID=UPI00300D15D9
MQDPTEPDRQDILDGPGRHPRSGRNNKKIAAIAASVLVAALAVGGVGYVMTSGDTPAQVSQPARQADQAPAEDTGKGEDLQDEEAAMGDAETDAPSDEAADDGVGDTTGNPGDPGTEDTPSTDTGSEGTETRDKDESSTGKKPTTKPTSKPTKPAQEVPADNPADGPAGAVGGQCAKSGC